MRAVVAGKPIIEEMVFFATNRIDYFMALINEPAGGFHLAGRCIFSSGEKKIFNISGNDRCPLREKMVLMGQELAGAFHARCSHVVSPLGISTETITRLLRRAGTEASLPRLKDARAKDINVN